MGKRLDHPAKGKEYAVDAHDAESYLGREHRPMLRTEQGGCEHIGQTRKALKAPRESGCYSAGKQKPPFLRRHEDQRYTLGGTNPRAFREDLREPRVLYVPADR